MVDLSVCVRDGRKGGSSRALPSKGKMVSEKGLLGIRHEGLVSDCVRKNRASGGDCTLALYPCLEETKLWPFSLGKQGLE